MAVIKTIIKSPSGKVSKASCIRDCNELPEKIKRNDVMKIVKKLVREGWLCEVRGIYFALFNKLP
jgi:hypothetical protein